MEFGKSHEAGLPFHARRQIWHPRPSRAFPAPCPRWLGLQLAYAEAAAVAAFAICQVTNMEDPGEVRGLALPRLRMAVSGQTCVATSAEAVLSVRGVWGGSGCERSRRLTSNIRLL